MIVFIRKLLDHVFTKKELQVLDDMLPDFHRKDRLDDEEALKVKVEKLPGPGPRPHLTFSAG